MGILILIKETNVLGAYFLAFERVKKLIVNIKS